MVHMGEENLAILHDRARLEHEYLCRLEDYPWRWPTTESVAHEINDSHTCPECGSYVEDGDW